MSDSCSIGRARITAIVSGFKTRATMGAALRSNAIENGRVLLELAKTRHAFERRAVALGYGSGALHVTAVRNPGIVCVAVEQVGLSCASDAQSADQDDEKPPTRHRHRL